MKRIHTIRCKGINESGIEWRVARIGRDKGRNVRRELQVYNPNSEQWEAL